ncbi:MAG: TolC family protein [Bacteroidetes bacterium]|jgi:outer membrane protein|nr:TolC family protein [Bacteroidota bacterium]
MRKIIIAIGLLAFISNSFAQTKDNNSYSFSLQQAIDFSLQNQNNIKNAMIDEQIAKAKVREITGMGLPQINASFDLKDFVEIPTSLIPAEIFGGPPGSYAAVKFGTQYQATAGLDASQLIFSGDYFLGLKASKVFVELSQKATQRTKIETSATVSKAYYTVLVNQERIKLMDANVIRIKKAMDDTKALLDNGFVEKIDYDRLSVAYNNLLVEQEKVNRLLELGVYLLKYQMGMDINANLTLTDKLEDVKFDITEKVSAEKFDYTKRVEYSLFETQRDLAQLDLKRNKFSFLPQAFAYGSLSGAAQRNEFDIFDTKKSWYPTALVGAKITLPIFTGGQRYYKTQQAKLKLDQAENNMNFMQKSIDLEIASTTTLLKNTSQTLSIQKKNIETAQEVYRVTKLKQEQGVGSTLEMVTAETALKEAQTNYFNALFDALVAKIDFDKATGTLK